MPGRSANTANPNDNYKFTGHERDEEAGLTLDYMMARNYDPIIGRFLQIDPMMEYASPYVYVGNNPINFLDPTGMYSQAIATVVRNEDTGEEYEIDDGYDFVFTVSDVDFNRIKENGDITDDLRGEWNAEFWRQVGQGIATSSGDTWVDKLLQFFLYDGIGEGLEAGINRNYYQAAFALTLGELKHLKKLKKWIKNNPGKKIPGTRRGGGAFKNREGKLPSRDSNGNPITYKEYDVNPTKAGANRDAHRMVVGSDGKTYYTKDHYNTFIEIKN